MCGNDNMNDSCPVEWLDAADRADAADKKTYDESHRLKSYFVAVRLRDGLLYFSAVVDALDMRMAHDVCIERANKVIFGRAFPGYSAGARRPRWMVTEARFAEQMTSDQAVRARTSDRIYRAVAR